MSFFRKYDKSIINATKLFLTIKNWSKSTRSTTLVSKTSGVDCKPIEIYENGQLSVRVIFDQKSYVYVEECENVENVE